MWMCGRKGGDDGPNSTGGLCEKNVNVPDCLGPSGPRIELYECSC